MMFGSSAIRDFALSFRNVVRQRRRSAMAISAVGFGVVSLLLAGGFIEWIYWAMREGTIESHLGHIQVTRPGYLDGGLADPFAFLLPENAPELQTIAAVRQVKGVAPKLSFNGLISHHESTISFIGDGVSPEMDDLLRRNLIIVKGEGLSTSDPHGVILGNGLAANLGADVGDTVVLLANSPSGGISAVEGHVRGLFSSVTKAYDDAALRLPLPMAQRLLRTSGAHRWLILLDDTSATDLVLEQLRPQLAGKSMELVPWYELADFYNKTVALFKKQVGVMKLIIAIIIVLSISNTLMMSVMERTAEIGTGMALGIRRSTILRLFVGEAAVLGLIGGVSGLLLGLLLAEAISAIGIPMPPPPGMARGFTGEILVTWQLVLEALALALTTTVLASLYPAWKASRMEIVNALRHNR